MLTYICTMLLVGLFAGILGALLGLEAELLSRLYSLSYLE